jgi:putative transposase
MITKAYKFRIYPTKAQEKIINDCFRVDKFIYNFFLGLEQETYDVLYMYGLRNGKNKEDKHLNKWRTEHNLWFNRFDASKLLTKMCKQDKYSFLKILPSNSRTYVLKSLESAMDAFMKGKGGFPKFKNKNSRKSFKIQTQRDLKIYHKNGEWYYIDIPSSREFPIKKLDIKIHNDLFLAPGVKTNSCTISKDGSQYFISFQVEVPGELPNKKEITEDNSVGIDFGVKKTVTLSSDDENPHEIQIKFLKESIIELGRLQKILSKKKKGSNKYNRIKDKISKIHKKISNQRSNAQHNISSFIVNLSADTIIMEDLNIKGMTKTPEAIESDGQFLPNGKKQKSKLNAAILDVGISTIKNQIQYKAEFYGKNVLFVNPQYTSQTCSSCGFVHKDNRISQSEFKCQQCGHEEDADKNASKNIKQKYFDKLLQD